MTSILWAILGFVGFLGMTVLSDMVSEEVRDRLDHLPHAILRFAARRLDSGQHITIYQDEWLPELTYVLKGAETRPITRLITGTRYALGILTSAPRVARRLHREQVTVDRNPSVTVEGLQEADWLNAFHEELADGNRVTHGDLGLMDAATIVPDLRDIPMDRLAELGSSTISHSIALYRERLRENEVPLGSFNARI